MLEFGTTTNGETVHALDLKSAELTVRILTFGAVINDVRLAALPDRPLTLGSTDVAAYEGAFKSFGSLMGPVVNRIRDARATIAGQEVRFDTNKPPHLQHSGLAGTHLKVWAVAAYSDSSVTLTLHLPDGEGGFPGNRRISAIYSVEGSTLTMEVRATTDAPTLFCFANHSYWNLDGTNSYAGHTLTIPATHYLTPDENLMPTGQVTPVEGTDYDLRDGKTLTADDTQFFDMNYCFSDSDQPLRDLAVLTGTDGVSMTLASTAPGLQVYDAGTMKPNSFASHIDAPYIPYSGFALEAQRWPGATAHKHFPTIEYAPDEVFEQTTAWTFQAKG